MITTNLTLTNGVTSETPIRVVGITFEVDSKLAVNPSVVFPLDVAIDSSEIIGIDFDETINAGDYTESLTVNTLGGNHDIVHSVTIDDLTSNAELILSLNGDMLRNPVTRNMELVNALSDPLSLFPQHLAFMKSVPESEVYSNPDAVGAPVDDGWSTAEGEINGVKYYFSSSTGDDSNDGTDIALPKKTWDEAQQLFNTMNAGDGIMLMRGDTWSSETEDMKSWSYSMNGTVDDPKVMTCYGLGNRPKLSGLKTQTGLTWTLLGNFAGRDIWQAPDANDNDQHIRTLLIDGVSVLGASALTEIQGDAKWEYFHDYTDTGIIYVACDPAVSIVKFPESTTIITHSGGSSDLRVKHLDIEYTRSYCLVSTTSSNAGDRSEIMFNTIGKGSGYGMTIGGADCKVMYNYIDNHRPLFDYEDALSTATCGGYEGIRFWSKAGEGGAEVAYNYIRNWCHCNVAVNGGDETALPALAGMNFHHNYFNADTLLYGGKISVQFKVDSMDFHHNFMQGGDSNQLDGTNGHYHHNTIVDRVSGKMSNAHPLPMSGAFVSSVSIEPGFNNNVIEHNIIARGAGRGVQLSSTNDGTVDSNIVRKNIMIDLGTSELIFTGDPLDIAVYLKIEGPTYYDSDPTNNIIEDNIIFQANGVEKTITVSDEDGNQDPANTYTVDEAEAHGEFGVGNFIRRNTRVDSNFLDSANNDFRYNFDSPAVLQNEDNYGNYNLPKVASENVVATTNGATQFNLLGTELQSLPIANELPSTGDFTLLFGGIMVDGEYYLISRGGEYKIVWADDGKLTFYFDGINYASVIEPVGDNDYGISMRGTTISFYENGVLIDSQEATIPNDNFQISAFSSSDDYMGTARDVFLISGEISEQNIMYQYTNPSEFFRHCNSVDAYVDTNLHFDKVDCVFNMPMNEIGMTKKDYANTLTYDIVNYTTDCDAQGGSFGLQRISFDDTMTKVPMGFSSTQNNQVADAVPLTAHSALEVIGGVEYLYTNNMTGGLHYYVDGVEQAVPTEIVGFFNMNDVSEISGLAVSARELFEVYDGIKEAV